jgi:hypothetical protein
MPTIGRRECVPFFPGVAAGRLTDLHTVEWIQERFKKKPKPIGFQPAESEQKEHVGIADKNRQ